MDFTEKCHLDQRGAAAFNLFDGITLLKELNNQLAQLNFK